MLDSGRILYHCVRSKQQHCCCEPDQQEGVLILKQLLSDATQLQLHNMASLAVSHVVDEMLSSEHAGKGAYSRTFWLQEPFDYRNAIPLYDSWVSGDKNRHNESLYFMASMEKIVRLAIHAGADGHVSSFQSRAPDLLYTGAIRYRCIVPDISDTPIWLANSVSGLPEMGDEAASVLTAEHMHHRGLWEVNFWDLQRVLEISQNPVYKGELIKIAQ